MPARAHAHAHHRSSGGSVAKMSPIQLWRHVLDKHGIRGVLRKTDPRYKSIKREYQALRG